MCCFNMNLDDLFVCPPQATVLIIAGFRDSQSGVDGVEEMLRVARVVKLRFFGSEEHVRFSAAVLLAYFVCLVRSTAVSSPEDPAQTVSDGVVIWTCTFRGVSTEVHPEDEGRADEAHGRTMRPIQSRIAVVGAKEAALVVLAWRLVVRRCHRHGSLSLVPRL